jgi:membrane protein YqaA with SNARE-associated domain
MKHEFTKDGMFEYNAGRKRLFLLTTALIVFAIGSVIASYFIWFKHFDFFIINGVEAFFRYIGTQIKEETFLGTFYAALFGGFFFVVMPMDALFIKFISSGHNPIILVLLYNLGLLISFTGNYYIGARFSELTKKLVTPEKFYSIKIKLNTYGGWAIFVINAVPMLPAQPLSALLGVFKYNKAKFYAYFLPGQLVKYSIIAIVYVYIL